LNLSNCYELTDEGLSFISNLTKRNFIRNYKNSNFKFINSYFNLRLDFCLNLYSYKIFS
jgi:hypothetical protein